ncbi:unnamed protein product [Victoria cruziana]
MDQNQESVLEGVLTVVP